MAKKFTRIAVVAFALCVLLALSSLAYGTDLMGRVTGLEDGTEYTYAKYDFTTDAYGEFAELTADTELAAGVWGIKAGDAEPEVLFVNGIESGYINFFDCNTGLQKNDVFGGKNDDYVPGKWTVSTDGAYVSVERYVSSQEVLLRVFKGAYQDQVKGQKYVTKDKVRYYVYLIDEAEYYLKDEVYYAVADNAVYEGEGEATPVMELQWINCVPKIGEANRLQESIVRYGFTNEQVVPAKDVVKFKPEGVNPHTGAMFYHTNEDGYTYTDADFKGTFTFVVKTLGSDEETRYTIDINKATKEFVAPAEMLESDGYLVAFEYAPYANCPDDIFHGHKTDNDQNCYAYINLYAGRNEITYNADLLPAPTVYDGYGVIGYDSEFDIEIAPATINADGTGLALGEWVDYEYDITAPRTLVGLYAVRAKYEGKVTDYDLAYAYGSYDERVSLGSLDEATGFVAVKGGSVGFAPGYWANTKWASGSGIATHSTFGNWYLGTLGGQTVNGDTIALKNAFAALAELKAAETPDEAAIAEAEKKLLEVQTRVADQFNTSNYTYGYKSDEIINVNEAESFRFSFYQNNAMVVFTTARTKIVVYVADRSGKVTPYSDVIETPYKAYLEVKDTFKFADFLPEEGWIVGIQIYCTTDIKPEEITSVVSTGNGRNLLSVEQQNYVTKDAPGLETSDEIPNELYYEKGVIKGFDPERLYEWAPFDLNGIGFDEWTVLPMGTKEMEYDGYGVVSFRYAGDGYSSSGSQTYNLAIGGNDDDIYNLVTKNTNKQKTVTVGGTAYNVFTIDGVEYYLNGDKYYAVADNSEYTGENAANAAKVLKTINVPDTVMLADIADNFNVVKFNEGKWSGLTLTNELAQNYGYSSLCLGCTSTPIPAALARALQAAEAGTDAAALATARKDAADRANGIYYSYGYKPEEVVKMTDFESISLKSSQRQSGFKLNGSAVAKLVFKVINEDGILVDRVVTKPVKYDWSGTTNTYTLADFEETEGYIVGIVYYPYVLTEGSYYSYAGNVNGDYDLYLITDGYKVNRTLTPERQPEGIVFDGNKITGLDADLTYEYGLYSIAGAIGEWTEVTGATEVTFDLTGLVGIRVKGDGIFTSASLPVVTYVEGDVVARTQIGNMNGDKPLYDSSKVDFWKPGTWTGDYLSWVDQTTGAYSFLDQNAGLNCSNVETLWLYQVTKEEAETKLKADAENTTLPAHWITNKVTSNPARLQAVINAHYAADNYEETRLEKMAAHKEMLAEAMSTRNISYAFDETEILPVDELLSMSFVSKKRQGGIAFSSVRSKVVVYVMDANANVTEHTWWSEKWGMESGTWKKVTADIQSIDTLPEEGWIVGIQFYPWADVDPATISAYSESRIDASSIAYAFGQQQVCMGYYPNEYTIYVKAPEVECDSETGVVSGLDANTKYVYAPYTINGAGEAVEVEAGATTLQLTDGFWGISSVINGITSTPTMLLYHADSSTTTEIGTIKSYGSYEAYDYVGGDVWEAGKWSGLHLGVHSSFGKYGLSSLGGHIWSAGAKALYEAVQAGDEAAKEAAMAQILGDANVVKFRYAYAADEIVSTKDLLRISFKSTRRMGSLTLGNATAKVTFFVMNENGIINEYVWTKDYNAQNGATFSVLTNEIANWPEEGWVVGFQINPWTDLEIVNAYPDNEGKFYSTMCTMTFVPGDYSVITGDEETATPVLTVNSNNNIIVSNYNDILTYVYSADGGKTWTEFAGNKFVATKASAEYLVKSLEGYPYEESEIAAITSNPVAIVGTTLVLDGRIGTRVYIDVDEEIVTDITSLVLHATKVNMDYDGVAGLESQKRIYGISTQNLDWLSARGYDEEKDLYYFTFYVPAKDADNTTVETELHYKVDGVDVVHGTVGSSFKVTSYIETAKALAEAGNEEFVKALPLVEALETYLVYADNYFNDGEAEAYTSTASTEGIEAATRTNATLVGAEFYGTSLLLEDTVTIRHYYTVTDLDAFNAAYAVEGKYGIKGNFIYFDIVDIPAQDLGKVKTMTIKDDADNVVYTVTYSAANYIVDMMNDDDANLVSLVNAMYDYYLAAVDYAK